jgi:hypothetical protein
MWVGVPRGYQRALSSQRRPAWFVGRLSRCAGLDAAHQIWTARLRLRLRLRLRFCVRRAGCVDQAQLSLKRL